MSCRASSDSKQTDCIDLIESTPNLYVAVTPSDGIENAGAGTGLHYQGRVFCQRKNRSPVESGRICVKIGGLLPILHASAVPDNLMGMSWEAFRLTSKSPSELMNVMGPNGVDALVRETLMECWKSLPAEGRTMQAWRQRAGEVFARNMRTWNAIKKPSPAAFFENLLTFPSDQFFRQAMVMCHMMLPRGLRAMKDVAKEITKIYQRNVASWEDDYRTFTKGVLGRKPKPKAPKKKVAKKKKPRRR
jgi:hypothetical protein